MQYEAVGEEGCALADDLPPWKREHVKLQVPKIHHGRRNIKKSLLILPDVGGSMLSSATIWQRWRKISRSQDNKKIMTPPK
jgi:hypothetical protein